MASLRLSFLSPLPLLLVGTALADPVTFLDGTLTTTGTLSSDYVSRGYSQNQRSIAPMLNLDWVHQSGGHLNVFVAPVDFDNHDDAHVETDLTAGFTHSFTPDLSADASVVYYAYPGSNRDFHDNYVEGIGTLTYDWKVAKTTALAAYSPEYFGHTGNSVYAEGAVDVPVKIAQLPQLEGLDIIGAFGHQYVENGLDYNTWRGGLTYNLKGFVLGATYVDTDVNPNTCSSQCDARFVFSVARSF